MSYVSYGVWVPRPVWKKMGIVKIYAKYSLIRHIGTYIGGFAAQHMYEYISVMP
jgi:hypothetical protein